MLMVIVYQHTFTKISFLNNNLGLKLENYLNKSNNFNIFAKNYT